MSDKNKQRLKNYCEAKKIASNFFDFFLTRCYKNGTKKN